MPSKIELLWSDRPSPAAGISFRRRSIPVMPGVEVISTAITHLMAGDGILRDPVGAPRRRHDCRCASHDPRRFAGMAAQRGRPDRGRRRRSDLDGGEFLRVLERDLAERGGAGRSSRAACDSIRRRAAVVGPAAGAVFRDAKRTARTVSGAGHPAMAEQGSRLPDPSRFVRTRPSSSSICPDSPRSANGSGRTGSANC